MPRLSKTIDNVTKAWQELPVEERNEILRQIGIAHKAMKRASEFVSSNLMNAAVDLAKAAAQAAVMPFGPGLEGVVIEVAGAIPELSAYVRQLMGD